MSDQDPWKDKLSPEAYQVCRMKGTEPPWSGALLDEKRPGRFCCACCGEVLFLSDSKFDSGSGWPSFFRKADEAAVKEERDNSHGMVRVEVLCAKCESHLGHVFEDGPAPTGLRFCINSLSLSFEPEG